ncbi:MAG: GNAT family N-acetyltransferase [Actinobacteria bacterium]|nr:GNAT family N-acetyltransferase [Actinomycetota bacterium]
MVVADPASELLDLVRSLGDPAPAEAPPAARARAEMVRRRFGLALPPPFAGPPGPGEPIRRATAFDGAAIASVKWRCFGTDYRGVFPDAFIDDRDVVPPASYWTGRAMVPPSRRHGLFVWGRPGTVHGYLDCGPTDPSDRAERPEVGEVFELYVDPVSQGRGGGRALLAAGEAFLTEAGFVEAELSVVDANHTGQAFYRAAGWTDTGRVVAVDLGVVAFGERRFARSLR